MKNTLKMIAQIALNTLMNECCSEVKASINLKTRHQGKRESYKGKYIINNN